MCILYDYHSSISYRANPDILPRSSRSIPFPPCAYCRGEKLYSANIEHERKASVRQHESGSQLSRSANTFQHVDSSVDSVLCHIHSARNTHETLHYRLEITEQESYPMVANAGRKLSYMCNTKVILQNNCLFTW